MSTYTSAHKRYYERKKEEARQYYLNNKDKIHKQQAASRKARRAKLRFDILELLGGKCVKCGFDDPRALQIDHINGNGASDRGKQAYITYYGRVLDEVSRGTGKYQLLCANCNWIKRVENREDGSIF